MKIVEVILFGANLLVLVIGVCVGIFQWVIAATHMLSIHRHYRPEIDPWSWRTAFNPFMGFLFTSLLTAEGQSRAVAFWRAIGLFMLCVLVPFAMALVTELVTGRELIQR